MLCSYDKNHHDCVALSLHVMFPHDYPDSPCDTCGQHRLNELEEKLKYEGIEKKEDCFYYIEEEDMGAMIPCCKKRSQIGDCPCEHCEDYISGSDAYRIVEEWQKAKKEK